MVLGDAVKRAMAILLGAFMSLGFGIIVVRALSGWIEATYIRGDDDMNDVLKIVLLIYLFLLLVGGWLGSAVFKRYRRAG
jgi:hypothetical protein